MKIGRLNKHTTNRLRKDVDAVITRGRAGSPYEDSETFNGRSRKKRKKAQHCVREFYLKKDSSTAALRLDAPAFTRAMDKSEAMEDDDDSCVTAVFPEVLASWVGDFKNLNKAALQSLVPEHDPEKCMTLAAVKQHWGGKPVPWRQLLHQNE